MIISFNPCKHLSKSSISILILQKRKQKLREAKQLIQGHTAPKEWSKVQNPVCLHFNFHLWRIVPPMGAIANEPTLLTQVALQIFGVCSCLSPGHERYGEGGAGRGSGMERGARTAIMGNRKRLCLHTCKSHPGCVSIGLSL